jgi:hypothetical protein
MMCEHVQRCRHADLKNISYLMKSPTQNEVIFSASLCDTQVFGQSEAD